MGKRARLRNREAAAGKAKATPYVVRPFEGLPGEPDWVAMRHFVPSATAGITLADAAADRSVTVCSLLPAAAPAVVRPGGDIWLGLQVQHGFGDASRELAYALEEARAAEPGTSIKVVDDPGPGTRLQDLVDLEAPFVVQVHEGFDFWVADVDDPTGQVAASLQNANEAAYPTMRLTQVQAAYWTRMGQREYLRWVMPEPEEKVLDALARLHAAGADQLVDDSRLIGSFRAHGLVVPVWELPLGTGGEALEDPAEQLRARLTEALAVDEPLTPEERSARSGLSSRQLTVN
jgi:hypothetical protein